MASKLLKLTDQEHAAAIWPLTENQAIKSLRREQSSTLLADQTELQSQTLQQATYRWLPLDLVYCQPKAVSFNWSSQLKFTEHGLQIYCQFVICPRWLSLGTNMISSDYVIMLFAKAHNSTSVFCMACNSNTVCIWIAAKSRSDCSSAAGKPSIRTPTRARHGVLGPGKYPEWYLFMPS